MIHRQLRNKVECDVCHKETDWMVVEDTIAPTSISDKFNGWILGYDVSGDKYVHGYGGQDFCGLKCLHEAIDEHFGNKRYNKTKE